MRTRRAFTLIEVMAALLIFAMTAVVLGAAYLNVLNSYQVAQRSNVNEDDIDFAKGQLLVISDLATAETGQEFDDGTRHVKWSAEVDPTSTTDLFTVTFTCVVSDTSSGGDKTTKETFMLLRPTWSDPTQRTSLRQAAASRIAVIQGRQAH